MRSRRIATIATVCLIFLVSYSISSFFFENRILKMAIFANIYFLISMIFIFSFRRCFYIAEIDNDMSLPRINIAYAALLFGVVAYSAAAVPLVYGGAIAEIAILGIIALAALIGWLLCDKRPANSSTSTGSQRQTDSP